MDLLTPVYVTKRTYDVTTPTFPQTFHNEITLLIRPRFADNNQEGRRMYMYNGLLVVLVKLSVLAK